MAIYEIFSDFLGNPEEKKYVYDFDGTLDEYLALHKDDPMGKILTRCNALHETFYVCTNFCFPIAENVTNQIIRYKDAFKIPQPALKCPYVLYWKHNDERKVILLQPNEEAGYLYAKGLYYCLTEPNGLFDQARNHVLALTCTPENEDEVFDTICSVVEKEMRLGVAQRYYDRKYLKDMEHMKELCCQESERLFEANKKKMLEAEDRGPIVYDTVARCFLLKKAMYVQFMMAKALLEGRFEGDIKKQRQCAKSYADEIPFQSYSSLWRYEGDEIGTSADSDVHA